MHIEIKIVGKIDFKVISKFYTYSLHYAVVNTQFPLIRFPLTHSPLMRFPLTLFSFLFSLMDA